MKRFRFKISIGWNHFVKCRIASSFHSKIPKFYRDNKLESATLLNFGSKLIYFLIMVHLEILINHCAQIHQTDAENKYITIGKGTLIKGLKRYHL